MTELLVVIVGALVVIAAATVLGPRVGVASPLVLVAVGVAASYLPVFGEITVEPEWILAGVLPPLLYASAVSMPAMNFRREFGAISGLSVVLVVGSALLLGLFFTIALPGLGFAWGVAIGAVISPTDAVATSIIKRTSVSKRVVAMLDGESLLNDATALVLLRTAIVATAASFSFWGAVGTVLVAVGALVLTILVRAAYVASLLGLLARRARRITRLQTRLQDMQERMSTPEGVQETFAEVNPRRRSATESDIERFTHRITRGLADIDYFLRAPLGWREGTVVVWAGMRGAVTVAAAQTLPEDTPQRSVLVLVAFAVATLSLLVQGGTIGPLLTLITPTVDPAALDELTEAEQTRIMQLLRASAETVPRPRGTAERTREGYTASRQHRLAVIAAQRSALLDARDNGTFDADLLASSLANLDASQIAIELRGGPA